MKIVAATNSVALFVASQLSFQEDRLKAIINDEKNVILKLEEKVGEYKRVIDVNQREQKEFNDDLNDERGLRVRQEQELDSLKIAYRYLSLNITPLTNFIIILVLLERKHVNA